MLVEHFLPFYATLMVFVLIAAMLAVDKNTPKSILVILAVAYSAFIAVYIWRHHQRKKSIRTPTLSEFNLSQKRPPHLAAFEQKSEAILRNIRSENSKSSEHMFQTSYASPYCNIQSLDNLTLSKYETEPNYHTFSNYSTVLWKEHYRDAIEAFRENITEFCDSIERKDAYHAALSQQGFKIENVEEAEGIVRDFLLDRAKKYFNTIEALVDEANHILMKDFNLSLTKSDSTRTNEIDIQEFKSILQRYFESSLLPERFTSRESGAVIERDLFRVGRIMKKITPLIAFPHGTFVPFLLLEIVKDQFKEIPVSINQKEGKGSMNLIVQLDFRMSWDFAPKYRSKNSSKILMILLAYLGKKNQYDNRIIKTFRVFQH